MRDTRKIIFILFIFSILFIGRTSLAFQNEPDGFRGIKWGTSIDSLKGMVFQESTDGFDLYLRAGDEPKIGTTKLLWIVYYFWRNKFVSVRAYAFSYENFKSLGTSLSLKFGEPSTTRLFYRSWIGLITTIMLQYDSEYDTLTLTFFSPKGLKEWADIVGKKLTEGF